MDEKKFLALVIKKVFDGAEVAMDTRLEDIEEWDSLAIVEFLGTADTDFGRNLNPVDVQLAETVRDLYDLLQ